MYDSRRLRTLRGGRAPLMRDPMVPTRIAFTTPLGEFSKWLMRKEDSFSASGFIYAVWKHSCAWRRICHLLDALQAAYNTHLVFSCRSPFDIGEFDRGVPAVRYDHEADAIASGCEGVQIGMRTK